MNPTRDTEGITVRSMTFGHLSIAFDDRVLRPRPWTVAQARWATELLAEVPTASRVLELCTGAGHIGLLTLAEAGTAHRLVAVDLNPVACGFARRNAAAAGLGDRVVVREGRLDAALVPDERFDLVIADPPWVPHGATGRFPEDPTLAIDGGDDGLGVARSCLRVCETHLLPGRSVVLQLGSVGQVDRIGQELRTAGSVLSVQDIRSFGERGTLVRLSRRG